MECALQVSGEEPHQYQRDAREHQDDEQKDARHVQSQGGKQMPAHTAAPITTLVGATHHSAPPEKLPITTP